MTVGNPTVKERAGIAPAHHLRRPRLQVHTADQASWQALRSSSRRA
jgi:hypothetical protein